MSWVAVAVVGGSVITAGVGAASSRSASRAAQRGADAATAEQARQYDQTRADFAPYRQVGVGALGQLAQLYGIPSGSGSAGFYDDSNLISDAGGVPMVNAERYANDPAYRYAWDKTLEWEKTNRPGWRGQETYWARATNEDWTRLNESLSRNLADYRAQNPSATGSRGGTGADMSVFFESPDYQFNLAEGQKAIDRSLAARGRTLSGAGVREGVRYASGMASNEFGNFYNRLANLAGIGQTATGSTAAAGANAANNIAQNHLYAGNARANGYMQTGQAVNNAVQGGIQNYMLYQYLKKPPATTPAPVK